MKLQVKLSTTAEITKLEENKNHRRYRLTYLEDSKKEKRYDTCFEGQSTSRKVNVTLSAVSKKKRFLVYFKWKLLQHRLMDFQIKMRISGRKNIFRDKQTLNKVPVAFLDVKRFTKS